MYICPKCGNIIEKESRFCGRCGNEFPSKICPKCNYKSYLNDYCINCGEELKSLKLYLLELNRNALELCLNYQFEEALKIYDKLLEFESDNQYLLEKARCLIWLGRYDESIEYCDTIINNDSVNYEVWYEKGYCLVKLNKFDEALECFDTAIELKPNYNSSLFQKAYLLFKLDKSDEVKEVLSKIKPDDYSNWESLCSLYSRINEYDKALGCVDEMLSLEYGYLPLFLKADICFELKKYDEALKCCQEASNFNPCEELDELFDKIKIAQNEFEIRCLNDSMSNVWKPKL